MNGIGSSAEDEQKNNDDAAARTTNRIATIKKDLQERLAASTKRIALLDSIMQRESKLATSEEASLLLAKRGDEYYVDPATDDIVALMLEAKADKRQQKGGRYEPFLIQHYDVFTRCALKIKCAELIEKKEPFHFDCILKTGGHCSPTQIDYDGENLRIFYIDAVGLSRNEPIMKSLDKKKPEYYKFSGGIQSDTSSCSTFSLQHLNKLSNLSVDDRKLLGVEEKLGLIPSLLPPVFLKNIQSTSVLSKYYEGNNQEKDKLKQHIANYSITVDASKAGDGSAFKTRNHAIDYKTHKYLQAALATVEKLGEVEAEALIDARCNINGKNIYSTVNGNTTESDVIKAAVENKDPSIFKDLVTYAVNKNKPGIILALIDAGADFNEIKVDYEDFGGGAPTKPPRTPIAWAISIGHLNIVSKLLDLTYDKNKDACGVSYFFGALTQRENFEDPVSMTKLLIDKGMSVDIPDDFGQTPLFFALDRGKFLVVQCLLEKGANVNATNNEGDTLLHIAVSDTYFDSDIVKTLLDAGADVDATNSKGETPLKILSSKPESEQNSIKIKMLLFAGSDFKSLPLGYLTREKVFDYFLETIKENNISAFDNVLKLRESMGDSLDPLISDEELLKAVSTNETLLEHFKNFTASNVSSVTPEAVMEPSSSLRNDMVSPHDKEASVSERLVRSLTNIAQVFVTNGHESTDNLDGDLKKQIHSSKNELQSLNQSSGIANATDVLIGSVHDAVDELVSGLNEKKEKSPTLLSNFIDALKQCRDFFQSSIHQARQQITNTYKNIFKAYREPQEEVSPKPEEEPTNDTNSFKNQ